MNRISKQATLNATVCFLLTVVAGITASTLGEEPTAAISSFVKDSCLDCHDSATKESGLNLESLQLNLADASKFEQWVAIHDRVRRGEMPPPEDVEVSEAERVEFLKSLSQILTAADRSRIKEQGRTVVRRLNRDEYENTLREVLAAPWLQIADQLPVDGVAHLFNKSAECLDVSHVQMTRFLAVADHALRLSKNAAAHRERVSKFYAREEPAMKGYLRYRFGQTAATRSIVPLDGFTTEPDVIRGRQPVTVGAADPKKREREAMGVFSGTYSATTKYDFTRMKIRTAGFYRLRFKTYSFMAGPNGASGGDDHGLTGGSKAWWRPDRNVALRSKRSEPVTIYALSSGGDSRWLTTFDAQPEPHVFECVVALKTGEMIRPDATRLVRTRPGWRGNPNATPDGVPGLALNWLEVAGPLQAEWPPASYRALFDNLPFELIGKDRVIVKSDDPEADARRLLLRFLRRIARRPIEDESQVEPYFAVFKKAVSLEENFTDAMIAAMSTILCSPEFLYLESSSGRLDEHALSSRLAYFLWNGPPDSQLVQAISAGKLESIVKQTDRLLDDPRSNEFVNAFLDYWLDLRDINANAPDAELYPDYYLDESLTESSMRETRRFFRELLDRDLPVRNLVDANFAVVNERLARHYGLPAIEGINPQLVELPADSLRGGLLTQASVLRVTANGTTTSPVVRGAWIMERIMGLEIPSPPSNVEAIEPDIRGATTIRQQLAKHREVPSCNACHIKFDGPGLALESFDVTGGWRDRYRAVGDEGDRVFGLGKNGHAFRFRVAQPVASDGDLEDVGKFADINELKQLLAADERRLARNLLSRLIVYSTGSPVSFADRGEVEEMLDRAGEKKYGLRTLIHQLVQSEIFRHK